MKVLIDDMRNLEGMDIICRNYWAGYYVLRELGFQIDYLFLDHDLGEEKSGYDLIKDVWNIAYLPPKIQLVTSNPVGRENMANFLMDRGYKRTQGIIFIKE